MEITDMNEAEVESYRYDPYGAVTITVGGTPQSSDPLGNPRTYTGRFHDEETGLYYYRARYYSPVTGRFLERDPIGPFRNGRLYEYCKSRPTVVLDPSGRLSLEPLLNNPLLGRLLAPLKRLLSRYGCDKCHFTTCYGEATYGVVVGSRGVVFLRKARENAMRNAQRRADRTCPKKCKCAGHQSETDLPSPHPSPPFGFSEAKMTVAVLGMCVPK
jgi:RHS repeat-associated protein